MSHTFTAEQWLPAPLEVAFAFFANPANLPRLMPRWQRARIERADMVPPPPRPENAPTLPGPVAGAGTRLTLSFRALPLLPLRLPWDAVISDFTWNRGFCDSIEGRGPFRTWRHCHTLSGAPRPDGAPGTLLSDHVSYTLPLGSLGRIADAIAVHRQIAAIFRFRHRETLRLLPQFAAGVSPR